MSDQAFYEFLSIGELRNIVKDVRHFDPAAKLTFTGTVKVHGTNTAVVIHPDGTYHCQSRSRIITTEDDNLRFAAWVAANEAEILHAATRIYGNLGVAGPYSRDFVLYGEFAGRGIQKGVAVNDTDRFFYVFAAAWRKDEDCEWVTVKALHMLKPESRPNVLFSGDALWMSIEIDFTHPETSQNSLVIAHQSRRGRMPYW